MDLQPVWDPTDPRLPQIQYERETMMLKYRRAEVIAELESKMLVHGGGSGNAGYIAALRSAAAV